MATKPRSEVTQTRIALTLAAVLAALGLLVFAGFEMVQDSLEHELATMAGRSELHLRLFQMQLFIGILVVALVVATGLVSTTLAQKGAAGRRRREEL
jgi:archaellum biogenesis protein FlaJ (TadC family)